MKRRLTAGVCSFLLLILVNFTVSAQVPVVRPDTSRTKSVTPDSLNKAAVTQKPSVTPETNVKKSESGSIKKTDTEEKKKGWSKPKTAAICSAVLPGLGQVYNGRIWKVPIIYAIGGGLGYLAVTNNSFYQDFRRATIARTDNNPVTVDPYVGRYTDQGLVVLRDYHRRNRDLSLIFVTFTYLLQILEANVDAHLKDFDVSDDLSLRISPTLITQNFAPALPGCRLSLTFR